MLHCHQCTDDTQLSISFPSDPDTAAGNLKQCLAEIGFWNKASWLLLNLDKAEIMLISRGKCFEDLVKFITAPSVEGINLASILSGVQMKLGYLVPHGTFVYPREERLYYSKQGKVYLTQKPNKSVKYINKMGVCRMLKAHCLVFTLSEKTPPDLQPEPPLVQLETKSSSPVANCLGEEEDPYLTTVNFQEAVESDKVSPESPFVQAKQPQIPQLLRTGLAF
ncbi:hypothetical protein BTVI_63997 [Pitangus sulphuratus]|nr:hypothetical protein BTVI_63997 [Pitangus sulphuratus]